MKDREPVELSDRQDIILIKKLEEARHYLETHLTLGPGYKPMQIQVLDLALEVMQGESSVTDLERMYKTHDLSKRRNKDYPQETNYIDLVRKAIKFKKQSVNSQEEIKRLIQEKVALSNEVIRQELIRKTETHLNNIKGSNKKHEDKREVLKKALEVLERKATSKDLAEAMKKHPSYDKAFFSSDTKALVDEIIINSTRLGFHSLPSHEDPSGPSFSSEGPR
ncbi:hypothetical protein ACNVED_01050 [Legionella sp. D16C41]|uniref:hypothetical protein n=1 Tax=Legionella sp. D16C41 TaxID=3402688 RepID=UPI003AF7F98E